MHLLASSGPLAGTTISLSDGVTVGEVEGESPSLRIGASNGGFTLDVLDSQVPIFLNGLPPTERLLEPHDELQIGESIWVVHEDEPAPSSSLVAATAQLAPSSTVRNIFALSMEDALLSGGSGATREARDLSTLLRVGTALSAIHGLATLDAAVAGLVLDVVPAEHVVFLGADSAPSAIQSAWSTASPAPAPIAVDPGLLERASKERIALSADIDGRQAIVVPMMAFGRTSGSIWVETARAGRLDEGHVRLLLVVAALAAVAREQARETARLQHTNELLQAELNLEHNMVGRSQPMRLLFDRIARVAKTDATILVRGESGTGKELVARAAHRNSRRADRAFIAINCAAITETLLESELFGHEKGAFTGAFGLKRGKLELADGGTLFLDEIGELPAALQAKLLRAIQEREFERVGGTRPIHVDFRLIAATNRDLEGAVKAGTFRQDLFYRLNVVTLSLPALRDRLEDLPLLVEYFVRKLESRAGRRIRSVAPAALTRLSRHDWPGNVRELENVIEQALALGVDEEIVVDDLPSGLGEGIDAGSAFGSGAAGIGSSGTAGQADGSAASLDYHETIEQTKRDLIVRALERAEQSYTGAARLLGVHPNYLHRLIRNLELKAQLEAMARQPRKNSEPL